MKDDLLKQYSIFEVKRALSEVEREYGREQVEHIVGRDRAEEIDREFEKEIALRVEPYWKNILAYERGGFFTQAFLRLKYSLRSKSGECGVPQSVLEAIVDDMMPDIRAFFESEEGMREFEEWKKTRELKQAEKETKSTQKKQ